MSIQYAKDAEKMSLEAASEEERQRTLSYILGQIEYAARHGRRRVWFNTNPFIQGRNGSIAALEWCFECLQVRGFVVEPTYEAHGRFYEVTIIW